jgi:RecG-like helicase
VAEVQGDLGGDLLPQQLRQQYGFMPWLDSLRALHQPRSREEYAAACKGLAFQVGRVFDGSPMWAAGESGLCAEAAAA